MSLSDWSNLLQNAHRNGHRVWFECRNDESPGETFRLGEMLRGRVEQNGHRMHELMQEARADDRVVHVETTPAGRFIVGMSIVGGECQELRLRENEYHYQVPLRNFERTAVSLDGFIERNRRGLRRIVDETNPTKFPFRRHGGDSVALAQSYFTEASARLIRMIARELDGVTRILPDDSRGAGNNDPEKRERLIEVYERDQTLIRELKRLYKGCCLLCGSAPLDALLGFDLLEGHHIHWLSQWRSRHAG
jgi:hypothetical protein